MLRQLPKRGKDANGNYVNPSNNGEAFSVIL
ncbi:MAG: BPSL0067 family protein [Syntrophobacterales bacterium]|nr:BPSL0067 family protein [Syntrophobacterales bacterium]